MSEAVTSGAIYDLGYQRYTGARLGRLYAFRTLFMSSLRTCFGLGRGDKAKQLPLIVVATVFLPALIQVAVASAAGISQMISYSDHLQFTAFLLALFTAGQSPELVVADRQSGVLSLYLSRPIKATDYALAKLCALFAAMLVMTLGPQMVLFVGKVFLSVAPWVAFKAEWTKLFPILGGTLMVSLYLAAIGLALACLASRRGYASASVIAFFLLTAAMSQIVQTIGFGGIERYAVLANPALLITGFAKWLFTVEASRHSAVGRADLPGTDFLYTIVTSTAIAVAILINRYRRGEP